MSEQLYGASTEITRVAPQTRVHHLQQMKGEGRKWSMLTAYDYSTARIFDDAGIPVLLFLAFISGAGYVIWALLMKNNPVSRIAVFGLIIPIMNVLLSALLNGEPLFEWNYLAALVLVCIGIFLVNRAPQTQETKA